MNERHAYKIPQLNKQGVLPSEYLEYILLAAGSDIEQIEQDEAAKIFAMIKKNPNVHYLYDDLYYAVTTIHAELIILSAVGLSSSSDAELHVSYNYYLRVTPTAIQKIIVETGNSGAASNDYSMLNNKPQINSVELAGNKTFEALGLERMTNTEIENLLNQED